MKIRKRLLIASLMTLLIVLPDVPAAANLEATNTLTPIETLGKMIFFDTDLSANSMMSCATCHAPEVGYTGPDAVVNETTGSIPGCDLNKIRKQEAAIGCLWR